MCDRQNIHVFSNSLFQKLNQQDQQDLSISFAPETVAATEPLVTEAPQTMPMVCSEDTVTIDLQESPKSVANIPQEGGMSLQAIYEKAIPSVVSISCMLNSMLCAPMM